VSATSVAVLNCLVLFADLWQRRWLLKALLLLTFPEAVSLNLLAAPLCVFIFGIFPPEIHNPVKNKKQNKS
jgi:hypothetical protein